MGEKIFGEIRTTEDLNELARNLRNTKEFDEIRLLCSENGISVEIAEEFINGNRILLAESGHQEKNSALQGPVWKALKDDLAKSYEAVQLISSGYLLPGPEDGDCVPMGTTSLKEILEGISKPTVEEVKEAEGALENPVIHTVEEVKKKLEEELKIYRDGDSKYVIEKLIELCNTDKDLLNAIMLPHKSYDKAFQYFYQKSRNVGYKMPHGNMVYLDNDKAVELSVEYFKRDDAAEEKKKTQKKAIPKQRDKAVSKDKTKAGPKSVKKNELSKTEMDKSPVKKEQETKQNKKDIAGQMSLFDF